MKIKRKIKPKIVIRTLLAHNGKLDSLQGMIIPIKKPS